MTGELGYARASLGELLNGGYHIVASLDGQVAGFYCTGDSALVPAGHAAGAYPGCPEDVVDFGLGMRPDLTGQGLGTPFLTHILGEIGGQHPTADIRLTVATFNLMAIALYRRFGFTHQMDFTQNGVVFQTMRRPSGGLP